MVITTDGEVHHSFPTFRTADFIDPVHLHPHPLQAHTNKSD